MIGLILNTYRRTYLAIICLICVSQTNAYSLVYISENGEKEHTIEEVFYNGFDTNENDVLNVKKVSTLNTANDLKALSLKHAENNQPELAINYLKEYMSLTGDLSLINDHLYHNIKQSKEFVALKKAYKPQFGIMSIIYFYAGFLGLYIFIILNLKKKVDRVSTILISLFVLFHSIFILHLNLHIINYQYYLPHSLFVSTVVTLLYGPLLYFYFKRIIHKYTFRWKDALHLIPSVILLIYLSPYYTMSSIEKFNVLFDQTNSLLLPGASVIITVKIVSLIIYAWFILKMYFANKSKEEKNKSIFIWQRNIIAIFVVYVITYLVYAGIITEVISVPNFIHFQVLVMVALVFYVAYISYVQPQVFKDELKLVDPIKIFNKYKNSGLTPSYSEELKTSLLKLLEEEKIYKLNNISMAMLSEKLGTTRHNTSQIINEHFDMNFFELINKYRIIEAQEMLKEDSNNNYSMIDVAYAVGFNNKVTFNKSFKKHALSTPTQFLKSLA